MGLTTQTSPTITQTSPTITQTSPVYAEGIRPGETKS